MKTTKRFDNAITKLYNAFHENRLNAMECSACAVGNICDGSSNWGYYSGVRFDTEDEKRSGYSRNELIQIESLFLYGTKTYGKNIFNQGMVRRNKDLQFQGLCAVVEYLCELDNIPNVMDYQSLFDYRGDRKQLETVAL